MDHDGGLDRVRVGGLCLLSSFICVTVFLIDYTPIVSFIFLSNHRLFFFLEGHPPLLPIPFLYQPTPLSPAGICCPHICIMCQSCTPNPNPLFEHTHTHKLTQMKSHKLVLRTILLIFETPIASIYQSVLCRSNMVDFLHSGCQFVKS